MGGKVAFDALISLGSQLTEEYIYSENKEDGQWFKEANFLEIGVNVAIDAGTSFLDGLSIKSKNKSAKEIDKLNKKTKRELRRANTEIADERIDEAKKK